MTNELIHEVANNLQYQKKCDHKRLQIYCSLTSLFDQGV